MYYVGSSSLAKSIVYTMLLTEEQWLLAATSELTAMPLRLPYREALYFYTFQIWMFLDMF